jgi:hypothetical protein
MKTGLKEFSPVNLDKLKYSSEIRLVEADRHP